MMHPALQGTLAGLAATTAMTAAFVGFNKLRPPVAQATDPLPPRQVAMSIAEETGVRDDMGPAARQAFTWTSHFAYGTSVGAAYAPLARAAGGSGPLAGAAVGAAFGAALWAANYLGALPALGLLPPDSARPGHHIALNLGAHLVYGAVLGSMAALGAGESPVEGGRAGSTHSRFR